MERRIALYEDRAWRQFLPLSLLRPVYELCCGQGSVRERLMRHIGSAAWGAIVREELADVSREEYPRLFVNDFDWLRAGPTLLVNGRCLCEPEQLLSLGAEEVGLIDDVPVALTLGPNEIKRLESESIEKTVQAVAADRTPVTMTGTLLHYPWHLIEHNREWLTADFARRVTRPTKANLDPRVAVLGEDEDVYIHPSAEVDPFVVIDARRGPVWVDEQVQLQAFTRLEGPCFVGRGSSLFRANIKAGTTIGPVCRVGGEVEESILHGYVNTYHDGFLGHGYLCPWVNLGALTTNSDLKNDYSPVRVVLSGEAIDTGSTKVGCFIGDHTKMAIGSFLNTGTTVGVMSLILPMGELLPKYVPPFSRLWHGELQELDERGLEAGIATARVVMSRRGFELTPAAEQLLRRVYRDTSQERSAVSSRRPANEGPPRR